MDWESFFIGMLIGGSVSWFFTRTAVRLKYNDAIDGYLRISKMNTDRRDRLLVEQREHIEKLTVTNENLRAQLHQLHTN